jgi:hypothetical protein
MAKAKRRTRKTKRRTAKKGRASSNASRAGRFEAKSPGRSTANNELIDKPDKIYR